MCRRPRRVTVSLRQDSDERWPACHRSSRHRAPAVCGGPRSMKVLPRGSWKRYVATEQGLRIGLPAAHYVCREMASPNPLTGSTVTCCMPAPKYRLVRRPRARTRAACQIAQNTPSLTVLRATEIRLVAQARLYRRISWHRCQTNGEYPHASVTSTVETTYLKMGNVSSGPTYWAGFGRGDENRLNRKRQSLRWRVPPGSGLSIIISRPTGGP